MGILSYGYKASKTPVGKKVVETVKNIFKGGKQKTTGTEVIKNVPIAKNIDTKRAIQDKVTKTVDTAFKKADLPPSVRSSIETKNKKAALKRDEGKKLKNISYKLDKLEEKVKKKFNKGGRVGLKKGSFPDYSGDGKTTMKDILMGRGVIPKPKNKKKMMTKKSKSPMDKTVRKS